MSAHRVFRQSNNLEIPFACFQKVLKPDEHLRIEIPLYRDERFRATGLVNQSSFFDQPANHLPEERGFRVGVVGGLTDCIEQQSLGLLHY